MSRLIILGAGGHGKVVADIARLNDRYNRIEFLDDNVDSKPLWAGLSVSGCLAQCRDYVDGKTEFFIAIGHCAARQKIQQQLIDLDASIATLVHPSAIVADSVSLGSGVLICAGAVINPDVDIQHGVIINTSASVDHDCVIGAYSHICPGVHLAGNVTVGQRCWVGIGANVIQQILIEDDCTIGAGATMLQSTQPDQTWVGVPARPLVK